MGINFPNAPTTGQLYPSPATAGVPQYRWNGTLWEPASNVLAGAVRYDVVQGLVAGDQLQARNNIAVTAIGASPVGQIVAQTATQTLPGAGCVGERKYATLGAGFSGSGTPQGCGGLTGANIVTPGVWDIEFVGVTGGDGATITSDITMAMSLTNGSMTPIANSLTMHWRGTARADVCTNFTHPKVRITPAVNTSYFVNMVATISGGNYGVSGFMQAIRVC
jgi:hypothetical protein